MSCTKCSEKFILKNSDGIIFFISEIEELMVKSEQFLNKLLLNPENLNGLISIRTTNVQEFFCENLDALKSTFNELESNAVENGKPQNFFIQLSSKGEAVTVRFLPLTDPEKTNGVKTLMGIVAKKIKDTNPEITYGKTNLQDFIVE